MTRPGRQVVCKGCRFTFMIIIIKVTLILCWFPSSSSIPFLPLFCLMTNQWPVVVLLSGDGSKICTSTTPHSKYPAIAY